MLAFLLMLTSFNEEAGGKNQFSDFLGNESCTVWIVVNRSMLEQILKKCIFVNAPRTTYSLHGSILDYHCGHSTVNVH